MIKRKPGKKSLRGKDAKRLPTGKVHVIAEKDETLLEEIKRIKRLQKGLYGEYEADEMVD